MSRIAKILLIAIVFEGSVALAHGWIPPAVQNFPMTGQATLDGNEDDKPWSSSLSVKTGEIQMQGEEIIKANLTLDDKDKQTEDSLQITKAKLLSNNSQTHTNVYRITVELHVRDHTESVTTEMTMKNNPKDYTANITLPIGKDIKGPMTLKLELSGSKVSPENSW